MSKSEVQHIFTLQVFSLLTLSLLYY